MQSAQIPQINLISKSKVKYDKRVVAAVRIRNLSIAALIVSMVLTALSVAGNMYISTKLNDTLDSIENIKMSLTAKQQNVRDYESLVRRIKLIQSVISNRREAVKLWQQLQSILPTGCQLKSFSLEGNELSISVSAPHILVANELIAVIESGMGVDAVGSKFDINRTADATYTMSIDLSLKKPNTVSKQAKE